MLLDKEDILKSAVPISAAKNCGIYFLIHKKEIVYVGQSKYVQRRLQDHLHGVCGKKKRFTSWHMIECDEEEFKTLETEYIFKFKPKLNMGKMPNTFNKTKFFVPCYKTWKRLEIEHAKAN